MSCPDCGGGTLHIQLEPIVVVGDGPEVKLPDGSEPQPVWYRCADCGYEARPSAFGIDVAPLGYVETDPPGSA